MKTAGPDTIELKRTSHHMYDKQSGLVGAGVVAVLMFLGIVCASPLSAQTAKNVRPLTAKPGENWTIRWNRSDDFNGSQVDWRKWFKKPEQFGAWSWDNDTNVSVEGGNLVITLRRGAASEPAGKEKNGGRKPSPYTSGMLKSYAAGVYGYYEAKIKGTPLFPGASPAFWIYSRIDDSIVEAGKVRYSEIDIVELTQRGGAPGNERISDHNLHAILSNGGAGIRGRVWRRPHNPEFKEAQANEYRLPFDPRDEFHIYGCRLDTSDIVWYVDGVEVGRKKNEHWHRRMNVALSLGLRTPYAKWENNRLVPNERNAGEGFPTSMQVDYVRVWELE